MVLPYRPLVNLAEAAVRQAPDTDAHPFQPFTVIEGDPACGVLLVCDHAGNALPSGYGDLGLGPAEFLRHIAYDPGAASVSAGLAAALNAPAVLANFSRLLIDANRGEDDPTLIMRVSDGTIVAGNARVGEPERRRRIARYHAPYHAAIDALIDQALRAQHRPIVVSIHSFTPIWRGTPRPWHAGILSDANDPRLAVPLLAALRADPTLVVGDNEPYAGGMAGDSMDRHGIARGLANAIVEIRQDLISDASGAAGWVGRLAPALAEINRDPALHMPLVKAARSEADAQLSSSL
jgi:predicted N-formylglutamate amidohydrolase